ncbi:MAG: UbiD family decarboxylase [Candidatus Bathyarchaeota archaeon]|nr:UbiD family decarboxylase [Candidatus Bathyarchaeota archaeon]
MVSFKQALQILESKGKLQRITQKVELNQIPGQIRNAKNAVIFENNPTNYPVASNICTRDNFCTIFDMTWNQIQEKVINALDNPVKPVTVNEYPFVEAELDLGKLPILRYYKTDPGPYVTSGVFVTECEKRNLSYHRMLIKTKTTATTRICHRHTWQCYTKNNNNIDIAICIGLDPALLFAAAISTKEPMDETEIAGGFYQKPIKMVKLDNGISVPADTEIVLQGKLTPELGTEGPFVDITGTYDLIRQQPVVEITKILTQKQNPTYYALIPGRGEHSFLMGFGKLPLIYKELTKVCDLKDLAFTDGGINWLGCSVSIKKRTDAEPKTVIETALDAHKSLKHVYVFDDDINLSDPQDILWALTTRFQADKNVYTYPDSLGSSLDPSSEPGEDRRKTCKAGFDCTIPLTKDRADFEKVTN